LLLYFLVFFLLALSKLGDPSKVFCLEELIVVLLFVLVSYFIEVGKYFAISLDILTSLLVL
jgi:hypothetical protein